MTGSGERTARHARRLAVAALTALAVAGCGEQTKPTANVLGATATTVSTESLEDHYVREKAGVPSDRVSPESRTRLLNDLKRLQSAAAIGERNMTPNVANAIELSRLEILADEAAEAAGVYATPTDAELQQAYQAYLQTLPASEFHVAHILVANEPLATAVIAELDGGEKFADVAAKRSADDSKSKGGDLGWIHPGHLPAAFFDALKALKPGDYTKSPVHTPYGWHVIELIEVRPASPPPFEQVKAQLATNLPQERYQRFLGDSLKAQKSSQ